MLHKRVALFALVIMVTVRTSRGDISEIEKVFQALLSEGDESALQNVQSIAGQMDLLRRAPAEQVQPLLRLAQECLRSQKTEIRGAGVGLFFAVALRPADSSSLMESYVG